MIRLLPYCLPLIRRATSPFRRVARPVGVATAAKVTAGAIVIGGRVCFDLLMWGGGGAPVLPVPVIGIPMSAYAIPVLPSQSVFGGYGGSIYGGSVDTRDFAALVPAPGVSVLPPGGALVVVARDSATTQPVVIPEPSTVTVFAAAVVLLAVARRFA